MTYEAEATYSNGKKLIFELEDYQVDDFTKAIVNKCPYKDELTGVISWLPPENLYHLIIRPNLESPQCLTDPKLNQS